MKQIHINQLKEPGFIDVNVNVPNCMVGLELDDGSVVTVTIRQVVFNAIMLHPYFMLKVPVKAGDIIMDTSIKASSTSGIQTDQYAKLMELTDVPYMDIITYMWETLNNLYQFIHINLGSYQKSLSLIDMLNIMDQPKVKKLINTPIDGSHGTMIAEKKFATMSKTLVDLVSTPGELKYNPLQIFMDAGALNVNQIPQFMLAYCARSDIDDQMMGHVINESCISGLKTPADFAIEALSAKKTAFYNSEVIAATQYFARVLRLMNMQFRHMYPGSCGSDYMLTHTVLKGAGSNYVGKVIYLNGERIGVNRDNCADIEGKVIEMASAVGCKYTDGVCERCAGRDTNHPWAYLPAVHLGSYTKSILSSMVSQNVLSAKHLIKTSSMEPSLFDNAKRYFAKNTKTASILFVPGVAKRVNKLVLAIPEEDMRPISDLRFGINNPAGFSYIEELAAMTEDGTEREIIKIADSKFMIHFSLEMLEHIHANEKSIDHEDGMVYIPMSGFDITKPLMSYVVVNDDMVAFSKRIKNMLSKDLSTYTSVAAALQDLANIIYAKKGINIFWLELLVKSLMVNTIDKEEEGVFRVIKTGIIDTSVASKLGHESIKKYFRAPATAVVAKGCSPLDLFFAF